MNVFAAMVIQGHQYEAISNLTLPMAERALGVKVHPIKLGESTDPFKPYTARAFVEKLRLFHWANYLGLSPERVMLIDADLMLLNWDWSIVSDKHQFHAVRDTELFRIVPHCREHLHGPLDSRDIFNTGLFIASKGVIPAFEAAEKQVRIGPPAVGGLCALGEQGPLNQALVSHGILCKELPRKYNTLLLEGQTIHDFIGNSEVCGWHVTGGSPTRRVERVFEACADLISPKEEWTST